MNNPTIFHSGPIVTASEARSLGLRHYFTGTPCSKAHVAQRYLLNNTCVACKSQRDRAVYRSNPEPVKARVAKRKADCTEQVRAAGRVYYEMHKKEIVDRKRRWRKNNPDHVRAKSRIYSAKRKARKLEIGGDHSLEDIVRILRLQKRRCACCKVKLVSAYHVDHIVPLARGGDNSARNIQVLCPPCNWSKHAKDPIDFMQSRGFLL